MTSAVYKRKIVTLKALSEIGKLLTSTLDLQELLKLVLEKVGDLLAAKNWSLLLVDELTNELYFEIVEQVAVSASGKYYCSLQQGKRDDDFQWCGWQKNKGGF